MALSQVLRNTLCNANTLQQIRHSSRFVPTSLWDRPIRQHRRFLSRPDDFWNTDPWDLLFPTYFDNFRQPYFSELYPTPRQKSDGFQVQLDVKNFEPKDISVKVIDNDNSIIIEAKHEERSDDEGFVTRHFTRRYVLPDKYSIKDVVSTLSAEGILTVKAPLNQEKLDELNVKQIEIQHEKSEKSEEATEKEAESKKS